MKFSLIVKLLIQFLVTTLILINVSHAGGIALGATRVIYDQDKKQATMAVINSTTDKRFLINTWVEDAASKKTNRVVVTPPMYVSEPKSESSLRIINTIADLPKDRESLFYLNVQAIPSVSKEELEKTNVLQLAILSRVKMMMRPTNLSTPIEDSPSLIEVKKVNNQVNLKNPTPYYMTLVNIELGGTKLDAIMLDPFSEKNLSTNGSSIQFQTINDFGAFTPVRNINIQ